MVKLSLNDQPVAFSEPCSLAKAMTEWGYTDRRCAVAVNGEFVPRSRYDDITLHNHDQIDVVAPVGGG